MSNRALPYSFKQWLAVSLQPRLLLSLLVIVLILSSTIIWARHQLNIAHFNRTTHLIQARFLPQFAKDVFNDDINAMQSWIERFRMQRHVAAVHWVSEVDISARPQADTRLTSLELSEIPVFYTSGGTEHYLGKLVIYSHYSTVPQWHWHEFLWWVGIDLLFMVTVYLVVVYFMTRQTHQQLQALIAFVTDEQTLADSYQAATEQARVKPRYQVFHKLFEMLFVWRIQHTNKINELKYHQESSNQATQRLTTQLNQAEAELRYLENIFLGAPFGIIFMRPDQSVHLINRKACQYLQLEMSQVKDRQLSDILTLHELQVSQYQDPIMKVLKEDPLFKRWCFQKSESTQAPVELEYLVKTPLDNEANKLQGWMLEFSIPGDLREHQKLLHYYLQLYDRMFSQLVVGQILVQIDGTLLKVNDSFSNLLNRPAKDLETQSLFSLVHPEDHPQLQEMIDRLIQGGSPCADLEFIPHRTQKLSLLLATTAIPDTQGMTRAFLAICWDLSPMDQANQERLNAQEKIEELNRLKSSFLANLSHEIRTPLNAIIGFATLINNQTQSADERSYAQRIVQSGDRLLSTINDILDLARLESNQREMDFKEIDVVHETYLAIRLLEPLAANKGLKLNFGSSHQYIYAMLDLRSLQQILNNLIGNALKFTLEGQVLISVDWVTDQAGSFVDIKVNDTGIGIGAEALKHIFEEFKQESDGYFRKFQGTGLGLSIVQKLVGFLKGEIMVNSTKGGGSTFTVRFPALRSSIKLPSADPLEGFKKQSRLKDSSELPVVLLVEDDGNNQEVTRIYLSGLCQLDTAFSGPDALSKASHRHYDAILLDIHLGSGMDGVETHRCLRQLEEYKVSPIVALTAYAMKGDRERFLQLGFNGYLSKPYKKEEIVEMVKEILNEG